MVGLLVLIVVLVARNRAAVSDALRQVSFFYLALSFGFTVLAKLLLAETARLAALRCGIFMTWSVAARHYNLTQLGKYLPGSIWHYAGRAVAYRGLGANYSDIRDALIVESIWVVGAATAVAIILAAPALTKTLLQAGVTTDFWGWALIAASAGLVLAVVSILLFRRFMLGLLAKMSPPPRVIVIQAAVWCLLGLALLMLARGLSIDISAGYAIGIFAGAYALGFLVPIAPAGLGIRDAALGAGLADAGTTGSVVTLLVLSRVIYMGTEVLLVVAQESGKAWQRFTDH